MLCLQPSWVNDERLSRDPVGGTLDIGRRLDADRQPERGPHSIGVGRNEIIRHDHTLDHVGDDGHPRSPPQSHGHHWSPGTPADRAIDPDESRRATEARPDELAAARLTGERTGRSCEVDGRGRVHDTIVTKGCRSRRSDGVALLARLPLASSRTRRRYSRRQ